MKKIIILLLALGLAIAGCSGNANNSSKNNRKSDRDKNNNNNNSGSSKEEISSNDFGALAMNLEALGAFQATFTMTFEGETDWDYIVVTRSDGEAMEYALAITGLSVRQDPGDIRLVHADGSSQMIGEGTDGLCAQFSDSFESGVEFLAPTDLINTARFSDEPKEADKEEIARLQVQGYSLSEENVAGWQVAEIMFWLDEETEAVMRYDLTLIGEDPFFGAGEGTVTATFIVDEVGPQEIEPVLECVIVFPLPEDATEIFQLPGLIVYETSESVEALGVFYHKVLLDSDWQRRTLPQLGKNGELIISYVSETVWLDIKIEPLEGDGSKVEMYFIDR